MCFSFNKNSNNNNYNTVNYSIVDNNNKINNTNIVIIDYNKCSLRSNMDNKISDLFLRRVWL
jgi:hypothetical protein